jgi:hypothetical protein
MPHPCCLEDSKHVGLGSGSKFNHTLICPNLKYPASIGTIICDPKLLAQAIEGEDIGNTAQIKIHGGMAKVSLRRSLKDPFIAVDANGIESRADVVDMLRAREQMDRQLTVEAEVGGPSQ